jgi:peroxiredoxin
VFAVGAAAKLADRRGSRQAVIAFGAPRGVAPVLVWLLIGAELAIAGALVRAPSRIAGAVAAVVLLASTTSAVTVNLVRGRRPDCNCFGALSRGTIGWSTVARNALLAVLAGFVVAGGGLPLAFGALALVAGAVWLGVGPAKTRLRPRPKAHDFALGDAGGRTWTIEDLLAAGRPLLLVFSQPACGACRALLPDLSAWHARLNDRLTVAIVVNRPQAGRLDPDHSGARYPVLLDPKGSITDAYQVAATPSAALIDHNGRHAAPLARGAGEISELLETRFGIGTGATPTFERRAVIARAARSAAALGAFPLVAAACGSSKSTSSTTHSTTTASTKPKQLKVNNTYICDQNYALCTNAPCVPSKHDPNIVICDCVVESGYSVGFTACPKRAPHGTHLYSTFSTQVAARSSGAMTCGKDVQWANCLDYPCVLDPNDPTKATCECAVVKTGPSFTFGGDCKTQTCGNTIWSGAHNNAGGPAIAAAMKNLGQPLVFPKPCPKA